MILNIHIFTSGSHNLETFRKTFQHFNDISHIIILKENKVPGDVKKSIREVKSECEKWKIGFYIKEYSNNDLEDEIQQIMSIKKQYPVSRLYFNITGGKKNNAIMAFIGSLWVDGIAYYWLEGERNPLEFPIPKISTNELAKNKLHLKILSILFTEESIIQSLLKNKIKTNPNNNKSLSAQTLSQSISYLEKHGLIKKERDGRNTDVSITLSGRLAYTIIQK